MKSLSLFTILLVCLNCYVFSQIDTAFYIDNKGYVGIGTTSPYALLHIKSSSTNSQTLLSVGTPSSESAQFRTDAKGAGVLSMYSQSGTQTVKLHTSGFSYLNGGNVGIGTTSPYALLHIKSSSKNSQTLLSVGTPSSETAQFRTDAKGAGVLSMYNQSGVETVKLHTSGNSYFNGGSVYLKYNGNKNMSLYSGANGGVINTYGPNGKYNVRLTYLNNYKNNGYVGIHNSDGVVKGGLYINSDGNSHLWVNSSLSTISHPTQKGKEIVYGNLHGPEVGAYCRGTAKLVNGKASIKLPDHFQLVANEKGMTVILTPLSAQSEGLAVTVKKSDRIEVQELSNGTGNYEFDWEVKAQKKGFEGHEVIQNSLDDLAAEPELD